MEDKIIGGGEFTWLGKIMKWILKSPRIMTSKVLEENSELGNQFLKG